MKRVMVIGCGGAGKSTLARHLGAKLALPVHHLDRLFWRAGWVEPPKDEWRQVQEALCAEPAWILDGNYGGTMDIRLAAADTVIFLDVSTATCLFGALRRFLRFRGAVRPDVAEGCPERLDRSYLNWIRTYRRDRRPRILEQLAGLGKGKQVIVLRSRRDITRFLNGIRQTPHPGAGA